MCCQQQITLLPGTYYYYYYYSTQSATHCTLGHVSRACSVTIEFATQHAHLWHPHGTG